MNKKRILSLLIVLLMTMNSFACSSGTAEENQTPIPDSSTVPEQETEETVPVETEPPEVAGPAQVDLGGYNFRIATSPWYNNDKIIYSEELTGEPVNDAVYNANSSLMNTTV